MNARPPARQAWLIAALAGVLTALGCGHHPDGGNHGPQGSGGAAPVAGAGPSVSAIAGSPGGARAVEPFSGVVSEQTFPNEAYYGVWGTDDEVWILGEPDFPPDPTLTVDPATYSAAANCDPDRYQQATILRRKQADADFAVVDQPATTWIQGLHGSSASDVWMVGQSGAVFQFDGRAWQQHDIRSAQGLDFEEATCWELSLTSVFARTPSDVWVVGRIYQSSAGPGLILHYDGKTWQRHVVDALEGFLDVWAASESDVWVVGGWGPPLHYDGATWRQVSPGATENSFFIGSIFGTASDNVWASGGSAMAAHFDGSAWNLVEPGQGYASSGALTGNAEHGVWLLSTTGDDPHTNNWRQSLEHWDGQAWQSVSSTTDRRAPLRDLHMTPSGQLWGVGRSVLRFR